MASPRWYQLLNELYDIFMKTTGGGIQDNTARVFAKISADFSQLQKSFILIYGSIPKLKH